MSGDTIWIVGVLALVPALVFLVLYFVMGRRAIAAAVVTAVIGAAAGAFLSSAGSAMATSVDPNEAMLRGAVIGLTGSVVVAAVLALVLRTLRI